MSTPWFVWLGSGRARRRKVAPAGQWLDEAARAGLPVPPGAILLDEFYRMCLDKELAVRRGDALLIPDVELWHNTLFYSVRLPRFERPVHVRPVAVPPDGRALDAADAVALAQALAAAWTAQASAAPDRHDVLIVEQVAAPHAGTATCLQAAGHDVVTLAGGAESPLSLARLRPRQAADESLPAYVRRLQMLLRGLGRTLGPGNRLVHWADDGRICWLVGVSAMP
jgi:pyruvate,water dikinase